MVTVKRKAKVYKKNKNSVQKSISLKSEDVFEHNEEVMILSLSDYNKLKKMNEVNLDNYSEVTNLKNKLEELDCKNNEKDGKLLEYESKLKSLESKFTVKDSKIEELNKDLVKAKDGIIEEKAKNEKYLLLLNAYINQTWFSKLFGRKPKVEEDIQKVLLEAKEEDVID